MDLEGVEAVCEIEGKGTMVEECAQRCMWLARQVYAEGSGGEGAYVEGAMVDVKSARGVC